MEGRVLYLIIYTSVLIASDYEKNLRDKINKFNDSLDNEHEVGVCLIQYGQQIVLYIECMSCCNPSLISFFGYIKEGESVELIQHISQISILLTKS